MKVGCIGLGHIGQHLAANLIGAGHELTVHDLRSAAVDSLVAAGAARAETPAEVARASEAVITCLPSIADSDAVVTGPQGLAEGFAPGGTWIEMSTTSGHGLRRLADLLAARGVATLEAPVTGGVHNASSGTLTVLVGGDEEVFRRHERVFDAVAARVFHVGELGKASAIKVITNMLAFIHMAASAEALMLAKRSGIDVRLAWEIIRASSGDSFIFETETTSILGGSYDVGFSFDLCLKDMGLAMGLGRELDVPLDIAGTAEQLYIRGRARYGGASEYAMVARLLEEACGTDLRAPGFPTTLEEYLAITPRATRDAR